MEEAAAVRRAASEATADVVPEALRDTIDEYVADGSVVPGVLTLLCARSVTGEEPDGLARHAAGVQLIYEGLRLTRDLAQSNPWRDGAGDPAAVASDRDAVDPAAAGREGVGSTVSDRDGGEPTVRDGDGIDWSVAGRDEADMAILAADVLVSRGFYLLARTEAAEDAVGVVRAFGRDQTDRETADGASADVLDRSLETDVLELAVTTGVAAAGGRPEDAYGLATDFAPETPRFAPAESFFDDGRRSRLSGLTIDGGRPLNRND